MEFLNKKMTEKDIEQIKLIIQAEAENLA